MERRSTRGGKRALEPQLALQTLAAEGWLAAVAMRLPPDTGVLQALGRVACVCKALRAAAAPAWQQLCVAWWPSCAELQASAAAPSAWRAFALRRVGVRAPAAAPELRRPLAASSAGAAVFLLDVFAGDGACVFSARLQPSHAGRFYAEDVSSPDRELWLAGERAGSSGLSLDEDGDAEEFVDAVHALCRDNADGSRRLRTQPHMFLRLCGAASATALATELLRDLHIGDARAADESADESADDAGCDAPLRITASFALLEADGRMTVIKSDAAAMTSRYAPVVTYRHADVDSDKQGEHTSHVLQWSCRFSHLPGATFVLNIDCAAAGDREDLTTTDGMTPHAAPAVAGATEDADSSDFSSASDDYAVIQAAEVQQAQVERLSAAIHAREAELRVLRRKLSAAQAGEVYSYDIDADDEDAEEALVASPGGLAGPREASPASLSSSDDGLVSGYDSDAAMPQLAAHATLALRLECARVALGWMAVGDAGNNELRAIRAAAGTAADDDEDAEPTESQQSCLERAQEEHFWQQLAAALTLE
jgi:hypothetical protein